MSAQTEDQRREDRESVAVRLASLQRVDGNKHCADCGERAPKWASWNLGVFICLQCAGLHRNHLGTHISKIRSVHLDAWTEEQVANMEQMGNIKANAVYEANLPEDFERPQDNEADRKSFLIDKYQLRKYMSTNVADDSIRTPTTNGGETSSSGKATKEREFAAVRIAKLLQVDGNNQCADCGELEPKWASWNLGIFICFQCAGMHRCVLGAYISKLRPLDLSYLTEEEVTVSGLLILFFAAWKCFCYDPVN
ncbi:stromal membrane-associated protein 2-like isoform X2 [Mizuhopecten yessoensis]|uniref:stromal membrane-associated protein 2-like isoform X2 n=1 Tax=Mizuhopecten yessoensis TaxID=6573 RepID=UPI000B45880B|nr:stromal membrane-associated protein 2-like isoform X2 [Mizuhopecten yessoensis]